VAPVVVGLTYGGGPHRAPARSASSTRCTDR